MNTTTIKKALESYLLTTDDAVEKEHCSTALQELACVLDRSENDDLWKDEAVLLTADAWDDILNYMTYDILGMRMKQFGRNMRPEYYYHAVREAHIGLTRVPTCYLEYGYEILSSLWRDNEENGLHDETGCFKD